MAAKKAIAMILAGVVIVILAIVIAWGNTALECNAYTISSSYLPQAFDGYRIAHVSDLHNAEMGENNENLLDMLREMEPDMIAITGDLIDSRKTDVQIALQFVEEAMKIAPCYYVSGNHEARTSVYAQLKTDMEAAGICVLENGQAEIVCQNAAITLLGLSDPSSQTDASMKDTLKKLRKENEAYTILLSHRPELFDTYVENQVDLVLSGHAHGGQFRLPFLGGILAPHQGFFPKYDAGIFAEGRTNMVVSRGIGNSLFPFRINNRPEVISITLKCAGNGTK